MKKQKEKIKSLAEKCLSEWAMQEFGTEKPVSWKEQKKTNKDYFGDDSELHNLEFYSFAIFMAKKIVLEEQK